MIFPYSRNSKRVIRPRTSKKTATVALPVEGDDLNFSGRDDDVCFRCVLLRFISDSGSRYRDKCFTCPITPCCSSIVKFCNSNATMSSRTHRRVNWTEPTTARFSPASCTNNGACASAARATAHAHNHAGHYMSHWVIPKRRVQI